VCGSLGPPLGLLLPYTPTNTINNLQTQIRQSLVKVFPFFFSFFTTLFFFTSPSSQPGPCATALITTLTVLAPLTKPKYLLVPVQFRRVSPRRRSPTDSTRITWLHVIACTWPFCTWLNSGLRARPQPCFHLCRLLSPLCTWDSFFMGITLLLLERAPCSSRLRGVCAVAPHHLKFCPFRRVVFFVLYYSDRRTLCSRRLRAPQKQITGLA
jgi:hypothetical protein